MTATEVEEVPTKTLAEVVDAYIIVVLERHGGNRRHAAAALGITRWSLARRIRKSPRLQAVVTRWHKCAWGGAQKVLPCKECGRQ